MATSKMTVISTSQLVMSYRDWIRGSGFPEAEIQVVIEGTVIILRRHCAQGTICCRCGNDDPNQCQVTNVDKLGFITEVQCLECGENLSTVCRKSRYYLEQIKDESVLERGDHIVWYRPIAYYHHGIVTRQCAGRVAVVAYHFSNRGRPFACVIEHEYQHGSMATMIRGSVYRVLHDDCYSNEYTALRAERTIGEEKYDLFEHNCDHSTTWCKTGLYSSEQYESSLAAIGRVALDMFLKAFVLSVFWLLQVCYVPQDDSSVWTRWGVIIGFVCLIVIVFAIYSIRKGCSEIKSAAKRSRRDPIDDWMESFRKGCTEEFFKCCCREHPSCAECTSRFCVSVCICCSFGEAICSYCARGVRVCSVPWCGLPASAVLGLVVGSIVRELVAVSLPLGVIIHTDDIVSYFDGQQIRASDNETLNSSVIIILAIIIATIVIYPVGVLISRWTEALFECACCQSNRSTYKYDEYLDQTCPVHDEVVDIAAPYGDYLMTEVPVEDSENQCSAVILL